MSSRAKAITTPENAPLPPPSSKTFMERLQDIARATTMAMQVTKAMGEGDAAEMNEAMLRLAQERLFAILVDEKPDQSPWEIMPKITRAVTELSKTAVMQAKMREDMKAKMLARVDAMSRGAGNDKKIKKALQKVREEIYGL
ncbi:MAG: DUF3486 family protein [Nitrospinota bacterium]|nr:DUF3486 family protein [Nitrospinota bacterium]MDH5678742.1 DUF3486 family protein [Nitrospinota bacterium]MDH5757645.1 DUF3486 family protein [Nitrospinota bacterium]